MTAPERAGKGGGFWKWVLTSIGFDRSAPSELARVAVWTKGAEDRIEALGRGSLETDERIETLKRESATLTESLGQLQQEVMQLRHMLEAFGKDLRQAADEQVTAAAERFRDLYARDEAATRQHDEANRRVAGLSRRVEEIARLEGRLSPLEIRIDGLEDAETEIAAAVARLRSMSSDE